ncbi:MAG: DUF1810 domain-containing protein [Halioglobus sp.]|nr:DUF1810 domain-containing protein [Halioglobus sp.]
MADTFNLQRFIAAQAPVFEQVLRELRRGKKQTHWMWFIFPQIQGLGFSSTAQFYALESQAEAAAYAAHPLLGPRLTLCAEVLLELEHVSALDIFGPVDEQKLRSCMTLFAAVSGGQSVFQSVLDRYFAGQRDQKTLDFLRT